MEILSEPSELKIASAPEASEMASPVSATSESRATTNPPTFLAPETRTAPEVGNTAMAFARQTVAKLSVVYQLKEDASHVSPSSPPQMRAPSGRFPAAIAARIWSGIAAYIAVTVMLSETAEKSALQPANGAPLYVHPVISGAVADVPSSTVWEPSGVPSASKNVTV